MQADTGLSAGLTAFYKDSNKTIQFGSPTFSIDVIDTDERVYGAISSLPAQRRTYGLSYTVKY